MESSPSEAVVEMTAVASNQNPMAMAALYESVDPDALDAMIGQERGSVGGDGVRVSFSFEDHEVTASSDGDVTVTPPRDAR